jgi:hypothetical protein
MSENIRSPKESKNGKGAIVRSHSIGRNGLMIEKESVNTRIMIDKESEKENENITIEKMIEIIEKEEMIERNMKDQTSTITPNRINIPNTILRVHVEVIHHSIIMVIDKRMIQISLHYPRALLVSNFVM